MAYKFSKGSQVIGDLKAADDAERNTQIDFGEDEIKFDTGGATRLTVENTIITTTVPIHISGSVTEGLRIGKAGNHYREIQFETDGVDTAFIQVDASEGMVIGCQSVNDEIIFQTTDTGGISEVMRVTANGRLGVGATSPSHKLDVNGDIRVRGNDIRDNSGNPAISFDGSANTTIAGDLSVSGALYHEDFIIAELSIPGVDLQTDTNAFTFNCPYSMTVEGLQLFLDQHSTSGNVTVVVSGSGNGMIDLSLTGTNTSATTTTVSNASLNGGDQVRFSITATPANAQGLRANLQFRRVSD